MGIAPTAVGRTINDGILFLPQNRNDKKPELKMRTTDSFGQDELCYCTEYISGKSDSKMVTGSL
jgi:hypothetical protein